MSLWSNRIGDGLVGMNLRVVVEYADPRSAGPRSVVVKLPSPDATSRATGIALRNYEREVCFYREIASTVDIRVARCHHAQWSAESGDFVLVLEDLAPGVQGDQITGCTVDQARTAVVELARLHGPRWDDPSLHEHEWLSRRSGPDDGALLAAMWQMMMPGFLATYGTYLSPEAVELIDAFGQRIAAWVDGRDGPTTVTHGDYRLDNLMFASADGGYTVAAVDWQTPGHGPPLGDVSYFLGAGLLPEQRREVERRLLDEYAHALTRYGVDVDGAWLWHHYRRDAFAGVIMAVIASQIVGASGRSEAMFAAMATRHTQHALDLDSLSLV
ncbi:MAG: phosphotransferase [Actinobacteria bacterium]|nr:phosphotransferase [Actinomycetota bacterium]